MWHGLITKKSIYITFDDGPHPTITPWVLDQLDKYGFKAVFFCIGANVRKYQKQYLEILARGHQTGNHTLHHISGFKSKNQHYFNNIQGCSELVKSELFRPPHGHLKPSQVSYLKKKYRIIMWSLLAEDWNPNLDCKLKEEKLISSTKPGDIVVFHDSEKAQKNLEILLPNYLKYLSEAKYESALFD